MSTQHSILSLLRPIPTPCLSFNAVRGVNDVKRCDETLLTCGSLFGSTGVGGFNNRSSRLLPLYQRNTSPPPVLELILDVLRYLIRRNTAPVLRTCLGAAPGRLFCRKRCYHLGPAIEQHDGAQLPLDFAI